MKGFYFLFLFLLSSTVVLSQNVQRSEEDVQTEATFIEAIRNKLIDRHDLSVPQFREILKKQPDNHVVWNELAYGLWKTKMYDEALDAANKAVSLMPRQVSYLKIQGDIFHAKQNVPEEINVYKKIQSIEPYKESNYTYWVDLLLNAGKWDDAIKVLNLLEQNKGINEISSLKKTMLFEQNGKLKEAEAELLKLNNAFPSDLRYLHALAGYYSKYQKPEKATEIYKDIIAINPGDDRANLALASSYKLSGQDEQYLQSLQGLMENGAISLDAKIVELIPYLEKAISKKDKVLLAIIDKYAANLAVMYPDEAKTHALSGDVLFAQGHEAEAFIQYQSALKLNQAIKSVWIQYLGLAERFEEPAVLVQSSERAFDLFPNEPSIAFSYSYALIKNGDSEEARSVINQLLLMTFNKPEWLEKVYGLELSLDYLEGKKDLALSAVNKIKSINSKSISLYRYPIELLTYLSKDLTLANELTLQAIKDFPHSPELEGYLGVINFKLKKYSEARSGLEAVLTKSTPSNALFVETYGDTLFMLRDNEMAISTWKKALELNPFSNRLKKKVLDKTL
jgi:tetratricopeptide (TPR) repeat protein